MLGKGLLMLREVVMTRLMTMMVMMIVAKTMKVVSDEDHRGDGREEGKDAY